MRSNSEIKATGTTACYPLCRWLLFQSDNLLIEHYELFLYHHVFVVVSEEPVLESALLSNLIEEVCQGILLE